MVLQIYNFDYTFLRVHSALIKAWRSCSCENEIWSAWHAWRRASRKGVCRLQPSDTAGKGGCRPWLNQLVTGRVSYPYTRAAHASNEAISIKGAHAWIVDAFIPILTTFLHYLVRQASHWRTFMIAYPFELCGLAFLMRSLPSPDHLTQRPPIKLDLPLKPGKNLFINQILQTENSSSPNSRCLLNIEFLQKPETFSVTATFLS
jgi:hypothetical protein